MYRPQFPYPPPLAKCEAQRCHYSFDGSNTPALKSVAAGAVLSRIPLLMDQDAPFLFRGAAISPTGLLIRIEDCFENPLLSDGTVVSPSLFGQSDGAGVVPFDSDDWGIYCPAGGALLLYVKNPTAGAVTSLVINLHGDKLFREGACS